jgi:hypothetical protein
VSTSTNPPLPSEVICSGSDQPAWWPIPLAHSRSRDCSWWAEGSSAPALLTCICGFATICAGVYLLHVSREQASKEQDPEGNEEVSENCGFRGTYYWNPPPDGQ